MSLGCEMAQQGARDGYGWTMMDLVLFQIASANGFHWRSNPHFENWCMQQMCIIPGVGICKNYVGAQLDCNQNSLFCKGRNILPLLSTLAFLSETRLVVLGMKIQLSCSAWYEPAWGAANVHYSVGILNALSSEHSWNAMGHDLLLKIVS